MSQLSGKTPDVGVVTNCFAFEDRVRSYELIAEVFGLSRPEELPDPNA